ncbi:MAG: glycosyltransferase family 4 protein [Ilumatobacteraceae bacterium]
MNCTALHQFVPSLLAGDAVGAHMRHVQRILHDHGVDSHIYAVATDEPSRPFARPYTDYVGGPAIYQFAVGHDLAGYVMSHVDRLVVNTHNVTPPSYFARWDQPDLSAAARRGVDELGLLGATASLGVADSEFNAGPLRAAGCPRVEVVPILIEREHVHVDVELAEHLRATRRPGSSDWLFTGRIVPNKAQHDVVRAFAWYRRTVDDGARLWLVGRTDSPMYERALRHLVGALGLAGAVEITGSISRAALIAHMANADVFVCLSDHEGFGVPLIEAMRHSLPVVAFDAGAVGETLRGAGILLDDKAPASVAAAVCRALDPDERARLNAAGRRRADELSIERVGALTWDVLSSWLEGTDAAA